MEHGGYSKRMRPFKDDGGEGENREWKCVINLIKNQDIILCGREVGHANIVSHC